MPPKLGEPKPPREGNWFTRLPTWAKWTIGVVAALLLLGAGAAIGSGEEDELKDDIAALEADLNRSEVERDAAEAKADELEAEQDDVIAEAEARADNIVGTAREEAASFEGSIERAEGRLHSAEGKLDNIRGEIGGEEERAAKSSISDGVWKAETDYIVGTYRARGGGGCYWEKLSDPSGEFNSIIANGGFEKNQILTVDSPYFSTSGCGTWELVE